VPRSNQADLPPDPDKTLLTFGADVQLRSEAKWPNGDIGGDSQHRYVVGNALDDLLDFLELIAFLVEEETKVMDPQHQTSPFCRTVAVRLLAAL
jgi:hypothetical protein